MTALDIKSMKLLDDTEELIVDKSERDQLYLMKKKFEEFARLITIPDEYYKFKDSYEWITLSFEMKSGLRDDLIQRYDFTYSASGICTLGVEFKTPKLLYYKGKPTDVGTYENIANEFSSEDVRFFYDDMTEGSDSVIWNADICHEDPELETGVISDMFEKLHAATAGFTRTMELEFWNSFDKSQISSFTTDPNELELDLSADYELYEGDTFIGKQAYMRIITEISGEELVINKHNENIVVESTEYMEFVDKEDKHIYRFEPDGMAGYVVKEQVLIDGEKELYTAGTIRKVTENALHCSLGGGFYNTDGYEQSIIVSYDCDAIRAFISPNTLIATIRRSDETDDALAFEGTTMMKCKYVVHTEQYFSGYMRLLVAIPYLDFYFTDYAEES